MLTPQVITTTISPVRRLWRTLVVRMRQWHLQTLIEFAEEDILMKQLELITLPQEISNFEAAVAAYRVRLIDTETELRHLGAKP